MTVLDTTARRVLRSNKPEWRLLQALTQLPDQLATPGSEDDVADGINYQRCLALDTSDAGPALLYGLRFFPNHHGRCGRSFCIFRREKRALWIFFVQLAKEPLRHGVLL